MYRFAKYGSILNGNCAALFSVNGDDIFISAVVRLYGRDNGELLAFGGISGHLNDSIINLIQGKSLIGFGYCSDSGTDFCEQGKFSLDQRICAVQFFLIVLDLVGNINATGVKIGLIGSPDSVELNSAVLRRSEILIHNCTQFILHFNGILICGPTDQGPAVTHKTSAIIQSNRLIVSVLVLHH